MRSLLYLLVQACLLQTVHSSWFMEEAKKCNPWESGLLPFSGFRIYREFKYEGYSPIPVHYLSLVHCDHGKVDYETLSVMPSTDIQWERPFCMLKPTLGKSLPLSPQDKPKRDLSGLKTLFRQKIDSKLESITNGKYIQYTGSRMAQHQEDIKESNFNDVLEWEAKSLVCYKMARKKKYAKKDFDFYIPDTFIGGLFECPISSTDRKRIISGLTVEQMMQPLDAHFQCDPSTARPIVPLIADASANQWVEYSWNPLKPLLKQTIPYLTTASPLDLRFAATSTPDMHADSWASQLHVNEDYDFSSLDLHYASKAVAMTANFINKLFIVDLTKIPFDFGLSRSHTLEDPSAQKKNLLSKIEKFDFNHKLISLLALVKFDKVQLEHIQKLWDEIK